MSILKYFEIIDITVDLEEDSMHIEGKTITELTQEMDVTKRTIRYHLKQIGGGKVKNENGVIIVTPQEQVALYERIKGETITFTEDPKTQAIDDQRTETSQDQTDFPPSESMDHEQPDSMNEQVKAYSQETKSVVKSSSEDCQASKDAENTCPSEDKTDTQPDISTEKLMEAVKYLNEKVKEARHQEEILKHQLSHRDQIIMDREKVIVELQEQVTFYQDQLASQHKIIDQEQQLHLHTKQLLETAKQEKILLEQTTRPKGWFTRWFIGG